MNEKSIKKLRVALDKLFKARDPQKEIDTEFEESCIFMEPANVLAVQWMNPELNKWFYDNYEVTASRIPEIDFSKSMPDSGLFSAEYMSKIAGIMKAFDHQSFRMIAIKDMPLIIEFTDPETGNITLKIFLAPRIQNE